MYDEYFGFSDCPFQATPDPRFFYSNRLYQEAFAGLRWGIKLRRGLMAMTGEAGTGKTTLIRMVAEKFEENTRATLIARYPGNFTELLRRLLIDFGFTNIPDDRLEMMEEIRRYATSEFQQERIAGVFLDQAQKMDVAALRQLERLADLKTDNNRLLQIVLVGSPELATKLDHPELRSIRERLALWCRIAPLEYSEVASYLDYRLTQAGYQGEGLFAPGAVEQIARFSKGIPREINRIGRHALHAAYGVGQKYISPELVHQVVRDRRIINELGAETIAGDSVSELQAGDSSFAPPPATSVQNYCPAAGNAQPLPLETESRQRQRPKDLGRLKIATLLAICALVGSPVALYVFEQSRVLDLNKDPIADAGQPISDGGGRKAYPNVIAKESAEETSAIQAPAPTSKSPNDSKREPLPMPRVPRTGPFSAKVYLHTSKLRDRVVLEQVGDALRAGGYTIPATRLTSGRTRGDVRFFFPQDRLAAERIKSLVEAEFADRGYPIAFELLERNGNKFQFAAPGKIEVWVPPLPKS